MMPASCYVFGNTAWPEVQAFTTTVCVPAHESSLMKALEEGFKTLTSENPDKDFVENDLVPIDCLNIEYLTEALNEIDLKPGEQPYYCVISWEGTHLFNDKETGFVSMSQDCQLFYAFLGATSESDAIERTRRVMAESRADECINEADEIYDMWSGDWEVVECLNIPELMQKLELMQAEPEVAPNKAPSPNLGDLQCAM